MCDPARLLNGSNDVSRSTAYIITTKKQAHNGFVGTDRAYDDRQDRDWSLFFSAPFVFSVANLRSRIATVFTDFRYFNDGVLLNLERQFGYNRIVYRQPEFVASWMRNPIQIITLKTEE